MTSGAVVALVSPPIVPRACPRPVALVDGVAMTAGHASSESEIASASRVLDGEPSSEAETSPWPARPWRGRTVVLGCGPSVT